ncbi:MAG: CRISPR-associated ring nuclease Csm6 [Limisphaerales bacterium]
MTKHARNSAVGLKAPGARKSTPPEAAPAKTEGPGREIVLLAVTGMSPAVLTETVWSLAHPSDPRDQPIIPHRVIVLTTTAGRREIESILFSSCDRFAGACPWDALRAALAARGHDLTGRLRFGVTSDDLRVFTAADGGSGRSTELEDIRTPAENEAAANFILDQVRGLVEDPDKTVIASLAGGRKTMGALLYACFTLIGRDHDRLTHVLVNEPYDRVRDFFFPSQPGGPLAANLFSENARVELADVPFVPLRRLFHRELGRPAGGFMRLVQACRAGVRDRLGQTIQLTVESSRAEIVVNGSRLPLSPREHLLMLFLATRQKEGGKGFAMQKEALVSLNEFRDSLRGQARPGDGSDWRLNDSLKRPLGDDQDIRRALSSLRDKIESLGGDAAALAACLPERGRFSLDVPAPMIFIKP